MRGSASDTIQYNTLNKHSSCLPSPVQDPEVSAAFQDVATNPANISKYQNNPRVQQVINKLAAKFGTGSTGAGEGPDAFAPDSAPGFS